MREHQGEVSSEPAQPPKPADPINTWPNGWTTDALDAHFGELIYIDVRKGFDQMITQERGFNARGVISNAWVQRCVEDGITEVKRMPIPSHQTVSASKDGVESTILSFPRSGYDDWIAFKGDGNAGWRWLQ
jgi:hypothetical protein